MDERTTQMMTDPLDRQLAELEQAKSHLQHANAETSARGHFRIVIFPPEGPAPLTMMISADDVAAYRRNDESDEIVVTYTMRYDREKASEYHESLYGGGEDDPVQGTAESLVADALEYFFSRGDCGMQPVEEAFVSASLRVGDRPSIPIPSPGLDIS